MNQSHTMSTSRNQTGVPVARIAGIIEQVNSRLNEFNIPAPPEFSEEAYLRAHPDVADLVRRGEIKSGYHHWVLYGRAEGRSRGK